MQNLKTDWTQYDIIKPEDFNRICEAVNERGELIGQLQEENVRLRTELANKANKAMPEIHTLDLEADYITFDPGRNTYTKTEDGQVFVTFACQRADGGKIGTGSVTIAVLPPNYRPAFQMHSVGYTNGVVSHANFWIHTSGQIRVMAAENTNAVVGQISFFAAP